MYIIARANTSQVQALDKDFDMLLYVTYSAPLQGVWKNRKARKTRHEDGCMRHLQTSARRAGQTGQSRARQGRQGRAQLARGWESNKPTWELPIGIVRGTAHMMSMRTNCMYPDPAESSVPISQSGIQNDMRTVPIVHLDSVEKKLESFSPMRLFRPLELGTRGHRQLTQ